MAGRRSRIEDPEGEIAAAQLVTCREPCLTRPDDDRVERARCCGRAGYLSRRRAIAFAAAVFALNAPTMPFSATEPAGGIAPSWRAMSAPFR